MVCGQNNCALLCIFEHCLVLLCFDGYRIYCLSYHMFSSQIICSKTALLTVYRIDIPLTNNSYLS